MIPLSLQHRFPWWATFAILFRELGITIFRALVISGGVISANRGGKLKTLSQNLGMGWFVLPLPAWLDWFKYGWLYVAVALTYITGYWYIRAWLAYRQDEVN
jgi:CDP-diacylglycerol--glycerol-3-phosphate 3-phosphatidyltransferase